jgi:hypothetical protein
MLTRRAPGFDPHRGTALAMGTRPSQRAMAMDGNERLCSETETSEKNISLFISLSFFASEHLVPAISQLVSDFCRIGLKDLDVSSRFHMAAHELAENITKYSTTSRVSLEVQLSEIAGVQMLSVRTKNRASPERLAEMEQRLEELKTTKDPAKLYDRMIEESAPLKGVSGLGLARIRAEGGMEFDYTIEGDELTLIVQAPVPRSLGPDPG